MKTTINGIKPYERQYPWLGKTKGGLVVLFTQLNKGVVLKNATTALHSIGAYRTDWKEEIYTACSLTLDSTND